MAVKQTLEEIFIKRYIMDNFCLMIKVENFLENKDFGFEIKNKFGITATKLSKDRTYSIPAYQREIRWGAENVHILIEDLIGTKKFLGTILLNKVDDLNYEIIDGQQRISVFILLLKAIAKNSNQNFPLCRFQNKTYECLLDVLDLGFHEDQISVHANKERYIESDILEQRPRFESIWIAIMQELELMNPEQISKLKENLLDSELNIIFANNDNSKIYVDYYLDLNDKSVPLDNIDILKANLFKIDFRLMANEWVIIQKAIKELRTIGLKNYSMENFYYHYFACSINKYIDYKLSTLKTDLKFEKPIEIHGHVYNAGTNILKAIQDRQYFSDAIIQLKGLTTFLKNVYQKDGLIQLKQKLHAVHCDNDTIECVIAIAHAIIHIDDEVPKMLIMKYFLEVLNIESINKSDVNIIFYIYVYSILFTLTGGKKESSKLIRIVLAPDWIDKLKKATVKLWEKSIGEINYLKKVTANGKVTDISGQYLPKHIMAIKEFAIADILTAVIKFDKKKLKEFLTSSTCTAEHFFINKSHKVSFKYGPKSIDAEIVLTKSLIKYISCPVNYLYITSDVNEDLGNLSIKDKIDLITLKGQSAFSSELCYKYFQKAKEVFEADGSFPDLASYTNKSKAQAALRKYYKEKLEGIMLAYKDLIKSL